MSLTELLLLIIVIAGAAYAGYLFGRQSVLAEQRAEASPPEDHNPLPAPRETLDPPARRAPPPASAGGDAGETGSARPRATAPPASAGGETSPGSTTRTASAEPRRTAAPPPARAGLLDTGNGKPPKKRG